MADPLAVEAEVAAAAAPRPRKPELVGAAVAPAAVRPGAPGLRPVASSRGGSAGPTPEQAQLPANRYRTVRRRSSMPTARAAPPRLALPADWAPLAPQA